MLAEKLMADDNEAVVRAVVEAAKGGEMTAARLILDRIAPPRRSSPVSLELPTIQVFTPSEAEVTNAQRILKAMDQAAKEGKGAVAWRVGLRDIASIRMAEALLTNANAIAGPVGSFCSHAKVRDFARNLTCGGRCFYIFQSSERRTIWPGRHPF
jgi:hypothetical protein